MKDNARTPGIFYVALLAAILTFFPVGHSLAEEISPSDGDTPSEEEAVDGDIPPPEPKPPVSNGPVPLIQTEAKLLKIIELPRNFLSDSLLALSERMDRFFSNSDSFDEYNHSYGNFSFSYVFPQGADAYTVSNSFFFVALPRTQQKLSLLLQTEEPGELDTTNPDLVPGSPAQSTNALALRGSMFRGETWSFTSDIGAENYDNVIDPFFRIIYRQHFKPGKWQLEWRESFFRFSQRGNGVNSRLRFDRPISKVFHLRFDNQVTWFELEPFIDRNHSLTLYQQLHEREALAYALGSYRNSDPVDTVYYAQVRYRQLLYKTWLFYELIPEVLYPEGTDFTPAPRFSIKLEAMLGNP